MTTRTKLLILGTGLLVTSTMLIIQTLTSIYTRAEAPASPQDFRTPYRVFRIGGERIGPWTVCGERASYGETEKWGSEGQVCVSVLKGNDRRAIACGTQMFVADTGQPCN